MAVMNFALNMNTAYKHGMDTYYWYRSGLCCRTQILVQSI